MSIETIRFPSGQLTLEGRLYRPQTPGPCPGVVVCHPHPLMGGAMDNNVVVALAEGLVLAGLLALTFNFRGVGRSEGEYSGGQGEVTDAAAALAYLETLPEAQGQPLALAGYSFGARVAAQLASESTARALVLISPPLGSPPFPLLEAWARPLLIVAGDGDDYCSAEAAQELAAERLQLWQCYIVAGADHFWWGHEAEVAEATVKFLREALRT
ncbi:MAG: alpha/beta fold hydrolase [Chloroflexi bacterium]|nr:alpha/beta fold hydrolase [Chloroflexota bacterium]